MKFTLIRTDKTGRQRVSTTADGNGVALFVRYALHADSTGGQGSGGVAPADTTQLADSVAAAAYEEAVPAYSRALGKAVSHAEPSARMTIDMPVDASPAVNLDAVPLTSSSQGRETILLIRLLTSRYTFRYNTVMGYTEYQPRCMTNGGWLPVDDRVVNSLTMVARLSGLDAWDKDVRRYVLSNLIPAFNPVSHFLSQARRSWDGQTDHIGRLARTVPCDVHQWEQWFRKWFLYMVAQWLGLPSSTSTSASPWPVPMPWRPAGCRRQPSTTACAVGREPVWRLAAFAPSGACWPIWTACSGVARKRVRSTGWCRCHDVTHITTVATA